MRGRIFCAGRRTPAPLALIESLAGLAGPRHRSGRTGGIGKNASGDDLGGRRRRARPLGAQSRRSRAAGGARDRRAGRRGCRRASAMSARCFHLINLAREEGAFVLFTARSAPYALAGVDPGSGVAVAGAAGGDACRRRTTRCCAGVIVKLAADRQLALDDSVVRYLSTHIERSFAAARAAVIALDKEALAAGRPPSRALAAEMFRDSAAEPALWPAPRLRTHLPCKLALHLTRRLRAALSLQIDFIGLSQKWPM